MTAVDSATGPAANLDEAGASIEMPVAAGAVCDWFLQRVPYAFARRHLVLAEERAGGAVLVHASRTDACVLHNLGVAAGVACGRERAEAEELASRIDEVYGQQALGASVGEPGGGDAAGGTRSSIPVIALDAPATDTDHEEDELLRQAAAGESDVLSLEGKGPVVRLVDSLLFGAISRGASDLHVQPLADATLIRMRVDGVLITARRMSAKLSNAMISRVKVMARMDVCGTACAAGRAGDGDDRPSAEPPGDRPADQHAAKRVRRADGDPVAGRAADRGARERVGALDAGGRGTRLLPTGPGGLRGSCW